MSKTEKENTWDSAGNHYVLFMDIMGFKDRVTRTSHDKLYQILKDFVGRNDQLRPLLRDKDGGELARMSQFSDSIIVVSKDDTKQSLHRIAKAAVVLMHNALEVGLPIKGAIAKGRITFDKDKGIYFGLPIVDAYLLEEELKFYGVAFHHSAEKDAITLKEKPLAKPKKQQYTPIEKYQIPLKSGKISHYCISYHKQVKDLSEGDYSNRIIELLHQIEQTVSGTPRIYIDNTISFVEQKV